MKNPFLLILVIASALIDPALAQVPPRVENTSLNMPPELFTSVAYELENLNPGTIGDPVAFASPPGDTRLFVVDRAGVIRIIDDLESPSPTVFLDLSARVESGFGEEGLLGLAFHPDYANNGHFYVFYTGVNSDPQVVHNDTLSRFSVSSSDPDLGDATSEVILIQQAGDPWSRNHNGGDLHFTPDGLLLVSLGDGGYSFYSQQIDGGFHGAMLRIDVDGRPDSLTPNPHPAMVGTYWIPHDNPFVGATSFNGSAIDPSGLRAEIFATGLRNPWRFSVDPVSGDILLGDVGEDSAEEINLIEAGRNYGWPFFEGYDPEQGTPPAGVTFTDPIHAYGRSGGLSVIGGFVYRGSRFPELNGHYIFTDWGNGEIRSLLPNGQNPVTPTVLASSFGFGPAAFAPAPQNGDILVAHGSIRRLVRSSAGTGDALPVTLTATGAFSNLATLTPNAGIVPYEINVPFWSDDAQKSRWFSLPDPSLTVGFDADGPFSFPASSVWIKHFEIEMTEGDPATRRRLETRFLVRNDDGVYGVTYKWNPAGNEADLVPEEGSSEVLARTVDGSAVMQTWEYPSRSSCLSCHSSASGWALGFDSAQLNRETTFGSEMHNQISALQTMGYFSSPPPVARSLFALADGEETSISLEYRARSYLQANCVQCHNGGGIASWDARLTTPLSQAGIINGSLNDNEGDPANRVIAPGDVAHSMIHTRISTRGAGQMPPIASHVVDADGVELIRQWIVSLSGYQDYESWSTALAGEVLPREVDSDSDGLSNEQEYELKLNLVDPSIRWAPTELTGFDSEGHPLIQFHSLANQPFRIEVSDTLTGPWRFLDVPGNRPLYHAASSMMTVPDTEGSNSFRFYRATWLQR